MLVLHRALDCKMHLIFSCGFCKLCVAKSIKSTKMMHLTNLYFTQNGASLQRVLTTHAIFIKIGANINDNDPIAITPTLGPYN